MGFIGPECLRDRERILRAALEDHSRGGLLGLPMGFDICYTNHAEADRDDVDTLLAVMGVPGADNAMPDPPASTTRSTRARPRRPSSRPGRTGSAAARRPGA